MCFGVRSASAHCLHSHAEDEQFPCERLVLSLGRERCPLDVFLCSRFHWKRVITDRPCTKCAPDLEVLLPIVVKLQRDARLYLLRKQVSKKHKREAEAIMVPDADHRLQVIPIIRYKRVDYSLGCLKNALLGEMSAAAATVAPYPAPGFVRAHLKFTSPMPLPVRLVPEEARRQIRKPASRCRDLSIDIRSHQTPASESDDGPIKIVHNSNPAPIQFPGNSTSPMQRYSDPRWIEDDMSLGASHSAGDFADSDDEDLPLIQIMQRLRLASAAQDAA